MYPVATMYLASTRRSGERTTRSQSTRRVHGSAGCCTTSLRCSGSLIAPRAQRVGQSSSRSEALLGCTRDICAAATLCGRKEKESQIQGHSRLCGTGARWPQRKPIGMDVLAYIGTIYAYRRFTTCHTSYLINASRFKVQTLREYRYTPSSGFEYIHIHTYMTLSISISKYNCTSYVPILNTGRYCTIRIIL